MKESAIPDHHTNVEENPDNIPWNKSASVRVDVLLCNNKFVKNIGPKQLLSQFCQEGVHDAIIPSEKQLENQLYSLRKKKFKYTNEITPLEEKLHNFVWTGNELVEEPFIYHYATNTNDRLVSNE